MGTTRISRRRFSTRGIPGSSQVVAIATGHHTYQNGKLILIDRSKGTQENTGATLIAPFRETPAERIDQYGQQGELFQYPYPLDDTTLCARIFRKGARGAIRSPLGSIGSILTAAANCWRTTP